MYIPPKAFSAKKLPPEKLRPDRKCCTEFEEFGLGDEALYVEYFACARMGYIPLAAIERVYKRLGVSKGFFEGKMYGTLCYLVVRYDGKEHVDKSDADCLDIPMAVLVNESSYSAAEFFAAALQEYGAGIVVGEKTVGKGYFQTTYQLSDGSAVSLSIGKYFTPKGVSLAGTGLTPDVLVTVDEATAADIYYGSLTPEEDPQIQAAVKALK